MEILLRNYLLKIYKIETSGIIQLRSYLWKVESSTGEYIVKAYQKSNEFLDSLFQLNNELRKKGFLDYPKIIISQSGKPWFSIYKMKYIVMEFVPGRVAKYKDLKDLEKVTTVLAAFHHHAGFFHQEIPFPEFKPINKKLDQRLKKFKHLYQTISDKPSYRLDRLDQKVKALGKDIIYYAEKALEELDIPTIYRFQEEAKENKMIAHRDVAHHNFLINKDSIAIIDFDLSGIEPQFLDLWQLLSRTLVNWKFDKEVYHFVIDKYNENRRLRKEELKQIRKLSIYPNEFIRECLGAYYQPKKYNRRNVESMLSRYENFSPDFHGYQEFLIKDRFV